jgi:phage tail sheath protein FI
MSAEFSPGVRVIEEPSDVRTIVGVATSITAFVGRTLRGPVLEPMLVHSFNEFRDIFGGLWWNSPLSYAVQQYFSNGGRDALIVRVYKRKDGNDGCAVLKGPVVSKPDEPTKLSDTAGVPAVGGGAIDVEPGKTRRASAGKLGGSSSDALAFKAKSPGSWGKELQVIVSKVTAAGANDPSRFNVEVNRVRGKDVLEREVFRNVTSNSEDAHYLPEVMRSSQLVTLSGKGAFEQFLANGTFTVDPDAELDGEMPADKEALEGVDALDVADLYNLLCIPPYTYDTENEADEAKSGPSKGTWDNAARKCAARRAVLIVDPPLSWKSHREAKDKFSESVPVVDNAVVYYPRILAEDPLSAQRIEDFAPCGVAAGVIARTDGMRGVWKAPAGIGPESTLLGVRGLVQQLTDDQCGELNPLGINCLRTFASSGAVVWGARTCRGGDELADQWKYLPVRRLAYYIEESLLRGLKWAVFEPNDERLWSQLRLNVGAFVHDLFRQGAFQGTSPRDAYLVKCDRDTTTQSDINRGVVNIVVGFAPLKPAEFVVLRLQQLAGQVQS